MASAALRWGVACEQSSLVPSSVDLGAGEPGLLYTIRDNTRIIENAAPTVHGVTITPPPDHEPLTRI
eukprot:2489522-Prymnesium_polylepis.1